MNQDFKIITFSEFEECINKLIGKNVTFHFVGSIDGSYILENFKIVLGKNNTDYYFGSDNSENLNWQFSRENVMDIFRDNSTLDLGKNIIVQFDNFDFLQFQYNS